MSETPSFLIIAMDGGAATGKSSTSRGVAERLDCMHVDTGAHYRTVTHALLQVGAVADNSALVAEKLGFLKLDTSLVGRSAKLSINGAVPEESSLRSPEVNAVVAHFAAVQVVRDFLFDYQRGLAEVARGNGFAGLIMEGRDIGSIIFPDADYRFFLQADEATRAARRAQEGQTDSITARDRIDSTRKMAPLCCPDGAIQIDTGAHSLEAVIQLVVEHIRPSSG